MNRLEKKAGAPSDNGNAHGADFQKENSTAPEPEVNPDLTEIGESPGLTEGTPPSSSAEADSFGIYYVLDGQTWRVRNNSGEWIPTGVEAVRRELWIEKGYSIKSEEGRASEVEQVLHVLEMNCYVDFVGQYEIREDGPGLKAQRLGAVIVTFDDHAANDVGGHEIGRELDAGILQMEDAAESPQ